MYVILKATNVCEDIACSESSDDSSGFFSQTLAKLFCGILTFKKILVLVSFHKYIYLTTMLFLSACYHWASVTLKV